MERSAKKQFVEEAHKAFTASEIMIVAHYRGLTVAEMTDLRVKVRGAGASFKVAKNRLAKIALKDTKFTGIEGHLKGPTAITYSADPVAAAKVLVDFAKDNDKLVILGGAFGDKTLDVKGIQAMAKLPSLNELRGKIIGLLQAPATKIAGILQAPGGQVARVISAHASKG